MSACIVIASGKGGTGKTTCTGALASALAIRGKRTLCIDCDAGLRNLDLTLGLEDNSLWDFSDILTGASEPERAVIQHPGLPNLFFLPAPPLTDPGDIPEDKFHDLVRTLSGGYDFCLVDSPAGIGSGFRLACSAADMAIIVVTPDSSSLRDGQRTAGIISGLGIKNIRLIVNRVNPRMLGRIRRSLDDIIDTVGVRLIGIVAEDESVPLAAESGTPLMLYGAKYAYDQFSRIAGRIDGERVFFRKL